MPLAEWADQHKPSVKTSQGIWTAEIYELSCTPEFGKWLRQTSEYNRAKEAYDNAKDDYRKAEEKADLDFEKMEADRKAVDAKYKSAGKEFEQDADEEKWKLAKNEHSHKREDLHRTESNIEKARGDAMTALKQARSEFEKAMIDLDTGWSDSEPEPEPESEEDENDLEPWKKHEARKKTEAQKREGKQPELQKREVRDRHAPSLLLGLDIHLSFSPSSSISDTGSIRLVQFKCPMHPDECSTDKGWSIDAHAGDIYPYFRWGNEGKPECHGNEFGATMQRAPRPKKKGPSSTKPSNQHRNGPDIDVRASRGVRWTPEQMKPGEKQKFVRGIVPSLKGKPSAQEGRKVRSITVPAQIIDTPREMCCEPQEALFATYAYDLENATWLGGVSWGYRLWREDKPDGQLRADMLRLQQRSTGPPLSDEAGSRVCWIGNINRPDGRVEVPP